MTEFTQGTTADVSLSSAIAQIILTFWMATTPISAIVTRIRFWVGPVTIAQERAHTVLTVSSTYMVTRLDTLASNIAADDFCFA
ncbi:hypothetical protein TG4357_01685 [Thalassovita gelatinovora]|uniref:Uncharacterized protein n=1 Tax=Thalassovita gelatinovora TaxID=53501 RepID=A0A0P1FAP7_THAGE|nr:hypothetical protein [Thalassovita gelatinovora]QIZ80611.1 hypothetical protein HFZ77_09030 [Thalassovita gelatinovora]CUH65151.1 hypothetical protein TG4357_01685 [Thalassovita gelatinovora]SER19779.1 hypothetical protein SAMN04488043_1214 [Thalassovita gelatinovora]